MKCKCIDEIETKIHAHFEDTDKDHTGSFAAEMGGKCLLFDGGGLALSLPVTVEYNRLSKSGNVQKKKKEFNMLFKYCPFCGQKIES